MRLCDGVREPLIKYIPVLSDYNNRKSEIEMSETIYEWMNMNLENEFVQKLGKIWLKQIMRLK